MNCPVCDRSLAPTLSICPACGAMMHDSVREELQTKVTPGITPRVATPTPTSIQPQLAPPAAYRPDAAVVRPKRPVQTGGLVAAKTSPTLVEFQNKNAPLPDWRIHLQNAVQQRRGGARSEQPVEHSFPTNGGAALKAEVVPPPPAVIDVDKISDPRVANAMKRIDQSRSTFATAAATAPKKAIAKPAPARQYPFDVVHTPQAGSPAPVRHTMPPAPAKPKLVVPSAPVAEVKRDTNKLPKLDTVIEKAKPIERVEPIVDLQAGTSVARTPASEFAEINRIRIKAENVEITDPENAFYDDEIEDLAPVSMRFGAGLFDLIIGGFIAMLVLAPFALNGENWFTTSGMLVATGVFGAAMFVYMTLCLGLLGRTLGMRLFSLELVDAVENEYPTLRQAAVSSSMFLLSLTFLGSGFLTMIFNEERRALHDLLSGTILVREF